MGKTVRTSVVHRARRKHPHVRGEDCCHVWIISLLRETPPRAWGRQRDFIVFFIRFCSFTLISKLPQAARGVPCPPPGRGTPVIFPLRQTFGRATPSAHAADAAMARARRRSRTPAGRTERRSRRGHHPGHRPGKVRADAPRDTRQTGYSPTQETIFALPPSGEYGGAGGVEGIFPLSPHAPRRAAAASQRRTNPTAEQDSL